MTPLSGFRGLGAVALLAGAAVGGLGAVLSRRARLLRRRESLPRRRIPQPKLRAITLQPQAQNLAGQPAVDKVTLELRKCPPPTRQKVAEAGVRVMLARP